MNERIAVAARIEEGKMWGYIGIRRSPCPLGIPSPLQGQARSYPPHCRQVHGRLHSSPVRRLVEISGAQEMVLGQAILDSLKDGGRRDRAHNEFRRNGLKRIWRQSGREQTGEKGVAVA